MQADGRARQSMGPHGSLLRVGERLRESLQGAARRPTDIKEDISQSSKLIRAVFFPVAFSFLRSNIDFTFHVLKDTLLINLHRLS